MDYFSNYDKHVHLIYETVLDPGKWRDVIGSIATEINAQSGVVGFDNLKEKTSIALVDHGFDQKALGSYLDYYHEKDVWNQRLMALPKNQFHSSDGQVASRTYLESEIYRDWARFVGVRYATGAYITSKGDIGLRVAFQRNSSQGDFGTRELAYLNSLCQHMQRAAELGHHLSYDAVLNSSAIGILEHSGVGVLLLNQRAEVVLFNSVAESWLSKDIFEFQGKRLTIKSGAESLRMATCLQAVIEGSEKGRLVHVPTQYVESSGGERIALDFAPFKPTNAILSGLAHKTVLVLFREATPDLERQITSFSVENQLTQSESSILRLMVNGLCPEQIAERRSRSLTTVRTQIRTILAKTNCHKCSELIAQFT